MNHTTIFPFSAIIGHDTLRLSLLLSAIDPGIGGVLIRGEKGTAKTTAVRALAPLLPGGSLVTLPIGATDDRVVGSLDVEGILTSGKAAFKPGLLSSADGGILYVDEINLLKDHLVDVLLDTAATGELHVERDGVSFTDRVRFVLVGTMNPEEGELRPQLLDRFGLAVDVRASREPYTRARITRLRLDFEANPAEVAARFAADDETVRTQIRAGQQLLPAVHLHDRDLLIIAHVCAHFDVDGMRADVVTGRAAKALAALAGREQVTTTDIRTAALLALPHRRRRDPFDDHGLDPEELDRALAEALEQFGDLPDDAPEDTTDGQTQADPAEDPADPHEPAAEQSAQPQEDGDPADTAAQQDAADAPEAAGDADPKAPAPQTGQPDNSTDLADTPAADNTAAGEPQLPWPGSLIAPLPSTASALTLTGVGTGDGGRGARATTRYGVTVATSTDHTKPLHPPASIIAAALRGAQLEHNDAGDQVVSLWPSDLRFADNLGTESTLIIFVVDTSGSMAAKARLDAVTGAIEALLRDAYQRRDTVAVIAVREQSAATVLAPTRSVFSAHKQLRDLPVGGHSPLAQGFSHAAEVVRRARLKNKDQRVLIVVLTDGRATGASTALADALSAARHCAATVPTHRLVIDCERPGRITLGLAGDLAQAFAAPCVRLEELTGGALAAVVTAATPTPAR